MSASEHESQGQGPVIRDRRRIDPVTGQPRENAQQGASAAGQASRGAGQPRPGKHAVSKPGSAKAATTESAGSADAAADQADPGQQAKSGPPQDGADRSDGQASPADSELAVKLAERTTDLQRLQAEYANYRKRVERDRVAVREQALASVVSELLPVLDDIGRAREHGELTGGFKAVAESLEAAAGKLGLTTFGEAGEPFDPNVHEALMHSYSPDVTETTCVQILQPGYKAGERILRPARVAVAEPTDPVGARTTGDDKPGQGAGTSMADSTGQGGSAGASGDSAGADGAGGDPDGRAADDTD